MIVRRLRDLVVGIVSLALVLLLLVGIPVALLVLIGFPLPTELPSLDVITRHVEDGDVPNAFVVKSLAIIVWLVWAQLAVALLTESFAVVRGRAAGRAPVLPAVQAMAGKLVASTVLIISAFAPGRSLGAAPLAPISSEVSALVVDAPGAAGPLPEPTTSGPGPETTAARAPRAANRYATTSTDNWWDMAERLLGDGMRWNELRALNSGRTMLTGEVIDERTEHVRAGWHLDVPPDADPSLLSAGGSPERGTDEPAPAGAEPVVAVSSPLLAAIKPYALVYEGPTGVVDDGPGVPYQVVEGDNLWDIADRHLGDPFRWPEIYERSRDLDQTFGRRITDPNLIWPDSILWLPSDAAGVPAADEALVRDVVGPVVAVPPLDRGAAGGPAGPVTELTAEQLRRATEAAAEVAERQGAAGPPGGGPGGPDGPDGPDGRTGPGRTERIGELGSADSAAFERPDAAPAIAFGAGGLLVASGLLGLLQRTRRLRLSQAGEASRPAPPPLELVDIETVLRNGADSGRSIEIHRALDTLADRSIVPGEPVPVPEVIRLGGDRVEVVQRGDDRDAPPPWAAGGPAGVPGRSIVRLAGEHLPSRSAEVDRSDGTDDAGAATPLSVMIGGGLLLNLEAVGVVAIDGPPEVAAGLVRSMVQELATGPARRSIDIRLSSWVPGADLHDRVVSGPLDHLAADLGPWLEDVELALTAAGAVSAYALRASDGPAAVPGETVVFADAADAVHLEPMLERARRAALPLAVVLTGDVDGAGIDPMARIALDGETLRLEPYGFTAAANHLDIDLILGVQSLIDQAGRARMVVRPDDEQATILPAEIATDPAHVETEETPEHDIVTELPPEGDEVTDQATDDDVGILIRVLGPLQVDNGPPELDEADPEVAVLAFLATVGPSSLDQIVEAVWPGGGRAEAERALDRLRTSLGQRLLDAGEGRYRVRSVTTDLGAARRWLTQAGALSSERARTLQQLALSEVRGRPFAGAPERYWQWVADHRLAIETQATTMLVDACFQLCDGAYEANDVHLAHWACDVGSLVDPLNETLVTRRVQLLQLQGDGHLANDVVAEWEHRFEDAAGRPAPRGPRAALQSGEVVASDVG